MHAAKTSVGRERPYIKRVAPAQFEVVAVSYAASVVNSSQ